MTSPESSRALREKTFLGHPRGLATLFFTEMWERFSYYGMRALLILFMTAATTGSNPGMGLDVGTAAAIYGLYTSLVYLICLPGGWVADIQTHSRGGSGRCAASLANRSRRA